MPQVHLGGTRLLDLTPIVEKDEEGIEWEMPTFMQDPEYYQNLMFDDFWNEERTIYCEPLPNGNIFIFHYEPHYIEGFAMLVTKEVDGTFSAEKLATYKKYAKLS